MYLDNGHVAECHERLLKGEGLDHQIPDCRVDRLSAFKIHSTSPSADSADWSLGQREWRKRGTNEN
jgi:hypothetical protein